MTFPAGAPVAAACLVAMSCLPSGALARSAVTIQSGSPHALSLRVTTTARAIRPGEVVLLTVTPSRTVAAVEGQAFDTPVLFWEASESDGHGTWQALVGIPVDTKAGRQAFVVEARTRSGETARREVRLTVAAARFATRRLQVDPDLAEPPGSVAARVAEESKALADVLSAPPTPRIWRGAFSRPVPGPATSRFGRLNIVNGRRRGRHMGVDLRAAEGAAIHAPNHGVVVLAADRYLSGQTIVLDHGGGILSLYAHLSRMAVAVGERVEPGALIGEAGSTGRVTGPHLHWAVRVGGTSVNPLALVAVLDAAPRRQGG
jgi:murein DD-endopeptidase MepM/ murein hydrolase activator NlpD